MVIIPKKGAIIKAELRIYGYRCVGYALVVDIMP